MEAATPQQAIEALRKRGIPADTIEHIKNNFPKRLAVKRAGLAAAASTLLTSAHQSNWLTIDGEDGCNAYDQ
eukprot:6932744-Alexandrium_andersonii.AAC.1